MPVSTTSVLLTQYIVTGSHVEKLFSDNLQTAAVTAALAAVASAQADVYAAESDLAEAEAGGDAGEIAAAEAALAAAEAALTTAEGDLATAQAAAVDDPSETIIQHGLKHVYSCQVSNASGGVTGLGYEDNLDGTITVTGVGTGKIALDVRGY